MSKRGGAARRGGRFLSTEEEERLRGNILRRNSLREREEGSEISATEEMEQVLVENPEIDSVADRVRRLEEDRGVLDRFWVQDRSWLRGSSRLEEGWMEDRGLQDRLWVQGRFWLQGRSRFRF